MHKLLLLLFSTFHEPQKLKEQSVALKYLRGTLLDWGRPFSLGIACCAPSR